MQTVENMRFEIAHGGTTRHVYEPRYVEPVLRALWSDAEGGATVEMTPVDPDNKFVGHLRVRQIEDWQGEHARLRALYEKHPRTQGLLFDLIYSAAAFEEAVARETRRGIGAPERAKPTSNVTEDLSALIALPVVGKAFAAAIYAKFHVTTPEELLTEVSAAELITIPRITQPRAQEILEACMVTVHGQTAEVKE